MVRPLKPFTEKRLNKMVGSRVEAIKNRRKYFFSGTPCQHNHTAPRFTSSGYCTTCSKNQQKERKARRPIEKIQNDRLQRILAKAEKLGISCDLDLKWNDIVWSTHCPVLGFELNYRATDPNAPDTASIDRIVPEKGYVKNNIRVISSRANRLKQDATYDEMLKVAEYTKESLEMFKKFDYPKPSNDQDWLMISSGP